MNATMDRPAIRDGYDVRIAPLTTARLLGRIEIVCDGERVDAHMPAQALMILIESLVHRGETLRRDELAFSLWPDLSESAAKTTLRRNLYTIAQSLPVRVQPWLRCDAKTICWDSSDTETWVDAIDFERLSEAPNRLDEAAALYGGDFAPKIDHDRAVAHRERLQKRSKRVLEDLIERCEAQGDVRGALRYCEQLLAIDRWREDVLSKTMRLRYRSGDRAGALNVYRTFRIGLWDEFGVAPMPETELCYESIRAGTVAA